MYKYIVILFVQKNEKNIGHCVGARVAFAAKKQGRLVTMKKYFIFVLAGLTGLFLVYGSREKGANIAKDLNLRGKPAENVGKLKRDVHFGKIPLYFIHNKGQVNKKAAFYAKTSRYTLWLTKEGLVFDRFRKSGQGDLTYSPKLEATKPQSHQENIKEKESIHHSSDQFITHHLSPDPLTKYERDISRLRFIDANKNPEMVPVQETKLKVNYFKGSDRSKWHCDVPTSQAVLYKSLYKHIDLKVYGIEKQIEYDWIVKPGGNPGNIRFQYKGVKGTRLDKEGNLLIETDFGELIHKRPISYQVIDEKKVEVQALFKKIGENIYGFAVGDYDRRYELIIDPVVLAYSTYLGGLYADDARDIVLDSSGYLLVVGSTLSWDFPVLNEYQSDQGSYDAFVSKLDTSGSGASSLLYSTFLGGEYGDYGRGIALDSSDIVYVIGDTDSLDFPILNQYMTKPPFPSWDHKRDAFVTKLDITQSGAEALLYSTYLGGEYDDHGLKITADDTGKVIIAGATESDNFPILNYFQTRQYNQDAFVAKLDTTQSGEDCLLYSTYLGGTGMEYLNGLAVDSSGYAYVAGSTYSVNFPTRNQYQDDQRDLDGYLTKIDPSQSGDDSLLYSTYLGGYETDTCQALAVDNNGIATIGGNTCSLDFPLLNSYQTLNGSGDAYITKLDTLESGTACLLYSTYLGGSGHETIIALTLDGSGNIYASGVTDSTDFPTLHPYQTDQPLGDGIVLKLNPSQSGTDVLLYSTYLGGNGIEYPLSITLDSSQEVYVAGYTDSTDFPTLNQYQDYNGNTDAFITRLYFQTLPTVTTDDVTSITFTSASGGGNVTSDGKAAVTARGVCWSTSENPTTDDSHTTDGCGTGAFTSSLTNLIPNTVYYVRAYATNAVGTAYGNEVSFETLAPSITVTSPNGGESWIVGTAHDITWTSDGVDGNIKIEYSTNNGDTWTEIIASTENDGIHPWIVPDAVSNQCLIQVSETDGSPSDTSDTVFTILPPSITVTSPNGGETWEVNSSQTITWTSTGTVGNVKIEYSTNNGGNWTEIIASTENDGTHPWTVPNTVSNQCLIRVSETDGSPSDTSDAVFTIFPPSLTVTSPNGGENWNVGSTHDITWTSHGTVGNVRIEYSFNGGNNWAIITPSTENDGSYNWNVPATPSDKCLVRVSETDEDGGPSDVSDDVFSIVSPVSGSITLRSPNGGETWVAGSSQVIKWNSTGDINNVTIQYSTDNGTTWKTIAQTTTNNGSYNWVVPDTVSDRCLVRVTANDNDLDPKPSDVSDAVFSIVLPPSPTLKVTAPNGGEQLMVGSRFTITWYAANSREDVQIEYSINGGETWTDITSAIENNGKYDWTVPDTPSDNCLVRISITGGQPSDVSDGVFSIVPSSPSDITVTSPNGGENWTTGSSQEIKWTSTGGIDSVFIEYSKDNGTTWKTIVQTTPNNGSYQWTVPDTVSDECLVRVIANDADLDPKPSDVSDRVFSIVPPESPVIRVIAPNGGEQLVVGSRFNITWYGTNTREDVKIEYSINAGETWPVITEATENDGNYDWIIPDTPSDNCLVRISETDGQPVDVSDAVFSIVPPLSDDITVTAPNGGESWTVGSLQEIKWTSTGDINNVLIEYSTDNGQTWKMIVQTTPNNGSFDWTIPETVSDECLVRVTANDDDLDPKPSDMSDEVFSIVPDLAGEFRVTSPNGGEEWEVGSTQSITWTSSGDVSSVMIEYSPDNGNTWSTIAASIENSGTYDWLVPDTVSNECLVRVSANDGGGDPRPSDINDEVFSIILPSSPTITVIIPNGGEQLIINSIFSINWFSTNSREDVKIEYSINGGENWKIITNSTENDGEYDWTVPDEPSEICLVRISETDGDSVDVSDAVFSIVPPLPGDLTVLTPNGGENLETGSEYNISWTCTGLNNVIIEYSVNNGVTWLYIDKVPADNGSYNWTVPGTPSEMCLVRITGADSDENPSDVSDEVFTIFDPSQAFIEVITPNGGENLGVGEEYYITWTSTGINSVLIEYSTDNGDQWLPIDTVSAMGGRYTWTVPNTPSDTCLVRISGNDSPGDPSDVSDSVFSIVTQ
jgi:hypothetical protein